MHVGFPVPPGFCVTATGFESCCGPHAGSGRFEIGEIPPEIPREILDTHAALGHPAVAVRSSADGAGPAR